MVFLTRAASLRPAPMFLQAGEHLHCKVVLCFQRFTLQTARAGVQSISQVIFGPCFALLPLRPGLCLLLQGLAAPADRVAELRNRGGISASTAVSLNVLGLLNHSAVPISGCEGALLYERGRGFAGDFRVTAARLRVSMWMPFMFNVQVDCARLPRLAMLNAIRLIFAYLDISGMEDHPFML